MLFVIFLGFIFWRLSRLQQVVSAGNVEFTPESNSFIDNFIAWYKNR